MYIDIEILGWCPEGLTSLGYSASLALVGHPPSVTILLACHSVTMEMPYGVDVLLHLPALHPIFSYWVS